MAREDRVKGAMAWIALPAAIMLHSITAWIFGLQIGRGFWYSSIIIDPEQRRPGDIKMPGLDQFGEVPEEQRQQQHLDVRAVDIRVTQDADLAVAQAAQVGRVGWAVWVDTDRDRDVVYLVVRKKPIALDLPRIEHLAAQRQDRLRFLVAAHLGAATGRIALDQKEFVVQQVAAFAIGQLAGQHSHS